MLYYDFLQAQNIIILFLIILSASVDSVFIVDEEAKILDK